MQCLPNGLKWCWLSLFVLLLDQVSKYLMSDFLVLNHPLPVFSFFNLTLSHNTGAAFGFLRQQPMVAFWLFSGIALVVSGVILNWLYRLLADRRWSACALSLVLGGAIGNLIDRFAHGYVVDFLDFHYYNKHFAIFNVADVAVSVGAVMLFIEVFFKRRQAP